jgi:hypothetical protein
MSGEGEGVELTEGERDALGDWWDGVWDESRPLAGLAPVVEAIVAARLAPVLALADEWQGELDSGAIRDKDARYCWQTATHELRTAAALRAAAGTPTHHNQKEGT